MSHQVEQMFSVSETPWHGLGNIVREAPDAAAAIRLAGLDWDVMENPVFGQKPDGTYTKIDSHKLLTRSTDNEQLGVVSQDFHVLQNIKAFNFFDPFLKTGDASLETAGSLRKGKTIWVLAHMNRAPIDVGGGDLVRKFFLLSNGHDGSMALKVGFTPIRVVCANTLRMAEENNGSALIRIFHTNKIQENLDKVGEIVNMANAKFEATAEQYRALVNEGVEAADIKNYVQVVFDLQAKKDETAEDAARRALRQERIVQDITRLFETGKGSDLKAANGTWWGLYNSVTEYLTYEKGRTNETRLNQLWFGENTRVNKKAFEYAVKAAV
jgi:phage/plasmid-like protein (TIGR03299 family)